MHAVHEALRAELSPQTVRRRGARLVHVGRPELLVQVADDVLAGALGTRDYQRDRRAARHEVLEVCPVVLRATGPLMYCRVVSMQVNRITSVGVVRTHLVHVSGIHGANVVGCEHLLELLEHHEVLLGELHMRNTQRLELVWVASVS